MVKWAIFVPRCHYWNYGTCFDRFLPAVRCQGVGCVKVPPNFYTPTAICSLVAPVFRLPTWTTCTQRSMSPPHHFSWRCAKAEWSKRGSGMPRSSNSMPPVISANAISALNYGSIYLSGTRSPNCAPLKCIEVDGKPGCHTLII